jgi:hypothetical protein
LIQFSHLLGFLGLSESEFELEASSNFDALKFFKRHNFQGLQLFRGYSFSGVTAFQEIQWHDFDLKTPKQVTPSWW